MAVVPYVRPSARLWEKIISRKDLVLSFIVIVA